MLETFQSQSQITHNVTVRLGLLHHVVAFKSLPVYTRGNKSRLIRAEVYISRERNHLYEYVLHKTRTAGIVRGQTGPMMT